MYLKEIRIDNFKSFGGKVKIPFSMGFTGITGPNGSGKSNISDAILFVLGPKSSKVIRAGRISDLIFNGGTTGRPAKECSVSLVFDNSDRLIPVDTDEVVLRRVVRKTSSSSTTDANSYFYINGRKSSLSEFDQILCRARISADGYNFVQQGDVNRIATMGPVERRRIMDTIAGITRFDEEISAAEKKKEDAVQNMEKISVLLDEISQRVESLGGERTEAVKYVEYQDSAKRSEALLVYKRLQGVEGDLAALKEQVSGYTGEREKLKIEKESLDAAIQEAEETINKLQDEISKKSGEDVEELEKKRDELRIKRTRAEDNAEDADEDVKSFAADKKRLNADLKKLYKEKESLSAEHSGAVNKKKDAEKRLGDVRREMEALESKASENSSKVGEFRKEEASLVEALESMGDKEKARAIEVERINVELESKRREMADLEEKRKDMDAEVKDADWEMKELKKECGGDVSSLQKKFYSKKAEEKRLSEESNTLESAVKRLEREYEKVKAQVEMAEKTAMGYSQPVMAVLEARDRGELKGVHGTLAELVNAGKDCETALSVAAGQRMQSIVVDSDEDAENAISFLKKNKMGRTTFLPLNKMLDGRPRGKAVMASRDPESLGFAADLLDFDDVYRPAVWYALGDTVVIKTLKDARRLMGGVRLVTLQGDLLEASGAMVGGTLPKHGKSFGASRGELENVGEELRKAREAADGTLGTLKALRGELSDLESSLREASGKEGQVTVRIESLKNRRDGAKKDLDKIKSRHSVLSKEIVELEKKLSELRTHAADHHKKIEDTKSLLSDVRDALANATPQEVGDSLRRLRESEKEELAVISKLQEEISTISPKLAVVESNIVSAEKALEEGQKKAEDLKKLIVAKRDEATACAAELTALSKMLSSASAETEALRSERDKAFRKKTELERDREKILIAMDNKEDFYIGLKTKLAALEEQHSTLESEWSEYTTPVPDKMPSIESLKKTLQESKAAMDAMGHVNLKALEEYDRQKQRFEDLSKEMQSLKDEKKALDKLVKDLVQRKTEGLMRVLDSVNENFKEVYARLSHGGDAELILENPDNPFDGGLLISAKPPGKKVLRLEALSGGEKSLVSMAFIISIQQFDPSPFYLLDEVDQNLDALNAENLARLVRDDSRNAQFIMISLRKVSLKEADALYGVTPKKEGVSQILGTVNLSDLKEPEKPEERSREDGAVKDAEDAAVGV